MNEARIKLPRKLLPVFAGSARYRGAHGGRGSGKSYSFALMLALRGYKEPLRILCAREYQYSLKDSSQAEIVRAIEAHAFLRDAYDYGEGYIRGKNGTEFAFAGLKNNISNIKSFEGVDIAWVEEAQTLSQHSLDLLRPTIRKPGSELWFSWNPARATDPIDQLLRGSYLPSGASVVRANWSDNPWFPDVLRAELEYDKRRDPDKYAHVWRGEYL